MTAIPVKFWAQGLGLQTRTRRADAARGRSGTASLSRREPKSGLGAHDYRFLEAEGARRSAGGAANAILQR